MAQYLVILLLLFSPLSYAKKIKLTIMHTNDHHGHFWADKKKGRWGGMSARKTLVDHIRQKTSAAKEYSLLLSGGDINTGTMESDIFNAEPDFKGMKMLGYDAMAVGNHEFDNSLNVLRQQEKWANFPFLAANIRRALPSNERLFKPYLIKNIGGVKVGLFGLTTTETPLKASHEDSRTKVRFTSEIDEAKSVVADLKEQGVDLIIALTHMGHHGSAIAPGDIKLATAVAGIDVIVGGHSQEKVEAHQVNQTIIVQAEDWGKYLGVLELAIDTDKSKEKVKKLNYELVPINLKKKVKDAKGNSSYVLIAKKIKENKRMLKLLTPYKEKANEIAKRVIISNATDLPYTRKSIRTQQNALGQLVGEALRSQGKTDIAIVNGGGIRSGFSKGPIRYEDIHNVHPYGNMVVALEMKSTDFLTYLQTVVGKVLPQNLNSQDPDGGYPQLIGLKVFIDQQKGIITKMIALDKSWSVELKNGTAITTGKKTISIAMGDFQAKGGDGYPDLRNNPTYTDTGFTINKALEDFILLQAKNSKKADFSKFKQLAKDVLIFN